MLSGMVVNSYQYPPTCMANTGLGVAASEVGHIAQSQPQTDQQPDCQAQTGQKTLLIIG
jgi:hypothetical protein